MNNRPDLELFSKWQSLSQLEQLHKWSRPEDLSGFFQRFKPGSAEVAQVFAGLPKGNSVLERLNQIYAAAQHNESSANSAKYLEVKYPPLLHTDRLIDLITDYFQRAYEIALAMDDDQALSLLEPFQEVEVMEGPAPSSTTGESVKEYLEDLELEFSLRLKSEESQIKLLWDAFHTITPVFGVAEYALWPLHAASTEIEEPFFPHFELWRHGVEIRFEAGCVIRGYVGQCLD